ncbi:MULTISPECIES: DUF5791 family protein [Halorubrum]|uniref:Uncharacterized protein n=1 Tax=Halorubrum sodomense TaxID=35743 RepID=A0A1I6FU90_HALSD|nr:MULTISPECIES: DUF5791 family protein [Halorubrum]TKX53637.1 hypothetical protein EXE42_11890 [Halorubrum sp. SP3]TKX69526.1 hypothetical protein EXE45_07800 [Halorubrum sp. SP9]SFR33377.1 hypothetical protein SAMN04487937_1199 [Halorubrum sodomense]
MFHEVVDDGGHGPDVDADETTAADLLDAFGAVMTEAASEIDTDRLAGEVGLTEADATAVRDGDIGDVTLTDAAAVLAAADPDRDADAIVAEVRDHLLMGMATAVLDVDAIAAKIDADLTGQEVQQALEGRTAMTLGQLAEILAVVERRKR